MLQQISNDITRIPGPMLLMMHLLTTANRVPTSRFNLGTHADMQVETDL